MKIDKGIVNLLTRSLRQGWQNSADFTNSVVLSLWSGTELSEAALTDIKTNYTWPATGKFQTHWPTAHQTPRGSVERARLVLHNFNDRYEVKPFTYDFDFSKRSEAFSILAAGSVASFTLMLVSTSWTGYTNAAANEGRLLISGTVGAVGSGADLELSSTTLTLSSRLVASAIHMSLSFTSYETGTWKTEGAAVALVDPYWHRVSFLANYNFVTNENKLGTGATLLSGTESYTTSLLGISSNAMVFDGNTVISYPNYALNAKTPGTGDFTYEIWCVPKMNAVTDISSTARAPWGYTTAAASNSSVYVYFNGLARSLRVAIGATTVIAAIPNAFLPNSFCHIAVQRRSGVLSLFVDGLRLASVSNNTSINASTLRVGSGDAAANNFIGDIDSIRFTNSARYDREFYLINREPNYYVDIPSDPDNDSTVCLIDFGIDPTKDLKTNEALIAGTGGLLPTEFDNGYAIFNGTHSVTTAKLGYGLGTIYTIEGIFSIDTPHSGSGNIFGLGLTPGDSSYFYVNGTDMYFTDGYPFAQNSNVAGEVAQVVLGRPNHLALVFDGTNMRGYINGRKIYDIPRTRGVPLGNQRIFIGSANTDMAYPFKGKIKTFRISNSVRYTDNFVPDGSFVKYNSFSAPEEVRIPKSDILETTTAGWTLIANAPTGMILSPADWSEALSKMVTGIKVIDGSGRVAFLSKEALRPTDATEIARTHRTPDTYQFQTGNADSYIYHHEIDGSSGQGLDYSYLFVNHSTGLIWNNSSKFQFNALGQPQLPASIYIH